MFTLAHDDYRVVDDVVDVCGRMYVRQSRKFTASNGQNGKEGEASGYSVLSSLFASHPYYIHRLSLTAYHIFILGRCSPKHLAAY